VRIRVRRQDAPGAPSSIDAFDVDVAPGSTIHAALVAIAARPRTVDGRDVRPPAWDVSCLEGSCGSCTVRVNGRPVLACATAIDAPPQGRDGPLIEPLARFAVLRDLVVDHARQDEALVRVRAGALPMVDEAVDPPADRRETPAGVAARTALAACIACGACFDACPETGRGRAFVGPEAIARNRLAKRHPAAGATHVELLADALAIDGGVAECGKAQACVDVCPVDVPLIEAIADGARDTSSRWLWSWLKR
jgi:succinate dehydrogenase / fumarate reductase iron-sulfur subunit